MTADTNTSKPATRAVPPAGGTWMVMLDGILLILLGVFLVIPSESAHDMLIRGLGLLLVAGAAAVGARLWMTSAARQYGPFTWLACVAPLVIGVILLIWPKESLEAIAVTVGIVVLFRGIVETSIGLANRDQRGWELLVVRGVITIALGIFFMWFRSWAAYLLLILLGIDLIAKGATGVAAAKAMRDRG